MEFSNATTQEFAGILTLNENAVPHVNSIGLDQVQWFSENAVFFRTVKDASRLAGFMIGLRPGTSYQSVNYRWFSDHYDNFAYVDRIVIAEWAQRRGLADALYADFARSQSDAAFMTCEVNIRPPNEGSMRFHKRLEFKQIATLKTEGGRKEVALLEKTIGGSRDREHGNSSD